MLIPSWYQVRLELGLLVLKLSLLLGEFLLDGLDLLDHPAIAVGDLAKVVEARGEVLEACRIQYDGEDIIVTMLIGA